MRKIGRVTVVCVHCLEPFDVYPARQFTAKFCSYACRAIPPLTRFERTGWTILENGCWEWNGARTPKGYGYVSGAEKSFIASRLSWEYHFGPIPDGLFALHSCDNPPCVNPNHLFLGTKGDNNRDMVAKGRNRVLAGEDHPLAVLSVGDVRLIRAAPDVPRLTIILGEKYGVNPTTIGAIRSGKNWCHVD
jgi:hypothetical protein